MQIPYSIKESTLGLSLVANVDIPIGTVIWKNDKHPSVISLTLKEIQELPMAQRQMFEMYCWQTEYDKWDGTLEKCDDPVNYINHSCSPNMHFLNDDTLVARKFISKGSPLTLEYATCDTVYAIIDQCQCGEENCRGRVSAFDAFTVGKQYYPYVRSFLKN